MNWQPNVMASFFFLLSSAFGCGGGKFSSNQGPSRAPEAVKPGSANAGSPGGGNPGGTPAGPSGPSTPVSPVGGGLVNTQQAECLLKKADKYNVTLVFDNSGSTNTSDPTNVRQQGALQLVKKFVEFVSLNPTAEVKMSTVRFARTASRGANGWVKLGISTEQSMTSDIVASTSNSASGTAYGPAVQEAQRLMSEIGASSTEKRQRNYMVFLSDGKPNGPGESRTSVAALFEPIVSSHGVAILSVAAGTGLDSKDEDTMQTLAKPLSGSDPSPKHVGIYLRAASPTDLQSAYTKIFDVIAGCE